MDNVQLSALEWITKLHQIMQFKTQYIVFIDWIHERG